MAHSDLSTLARSYLVRTVRDFPLPPVHGQVFNLLQAGGRRPRDGSPTAPTRYQLVPRNSSFRSLHPRSYPKSASLQNPPVRGWGWSNDWCWKGWVRGELEPRRYAHQFRHLDSG